MLKVKTNLIKKKKANFLASILEIAVKVSKIFK